MSTVPDKKTSKSRTKRRYKKWAYEKKKKLLKRAKLVPCPQCKEMKLSHTVCATCGAYGSVKEVAKKEEVKNPKSEKVKASPIKKKSAAKKEDKKEAAPKKKAEK